MERQLRLGNEHFSKGLKLVIRLLARYRSSSIGASTKPNASMLPIPLSSIIRPIVTQIKFVQVSEPNHTNRLDKLLSLRVLIY